MRPALWYRLWTSGGPLVAVVLAAIEGLVILDSHAAWRGDALWAVHQLGSAVDLGLPVFVILCALPPVLRGGARTDGELTGHASPRSRLQRAAVDIGPPLLVHLVIVTGVAVYTGSHGSLFAWGALAWTIGVQLLSIAVACALGRAIGDIGGHVVAVAAAGLVGVLLAGFAGNVFRVTAGDSSYAGLSLSGDGYLAAVLAMSLALIVVVLRHRLRTAAAAAVGVTVLGLLVTADLLEEPTLVPSGAQPTSCEAVEGVPVCVFPGYDFMRTSLVSDLGAALEALDANGIDARLSRVEQSVPGHVERAGTVSIPFDRASLVAGGLRPPVVRGAVLHPTWCARLNSPEPLPRQFDRDQRTAYYWLTHAMGEIGDADYREAVPTFASRSAARQRDFVQAFLDRNASCEGLT